MGALTARERLLRWAPALGVGLLAAAPLAGMLARGQVPGRAEGPVDGVHSVLYYVLAARRLLGAADPLQLTEMWHPLGRPLLLAQQNVVDAVLAAPMIAALGPARGTTLLVALTLITNALAGAWLAGRVRDDPWARLAGALTLGLSPYVYDEVQFGRYTQAWLAPTALAAGLAWTAAGRAAARERWVGTACAAGGALALAGYHYWFYGAFAAVVLLGIGAGRGWRGLGAVALAGGVAIALVAPFAAHVVTAWEDVPGAGTRPPFASAMRAFAGLPGGEAGIYFPQPLVLGALLALWRGSVGDESWGGGPATRNAPGPRAALGVLVAAGWLYALALGEYLRVGGQTLATPYHYLLELPFFDRFWWPQRALGAVTVAVAIPLALACTGRARTLGVLTATVLSALQALRAPGWPEAWTPEPVPAWHAALPPGPVLEVPVLGVREGILAFSAWPTHQRPLVNGMSMWTRALWPADFRAWTERDPLLSGLLALEEGRAPAAAASVEGLRAAGVVGVVAREGALAAGERAWIDAALGPPRCEARFCWWNLAETRP